METTGGEQGEAEGTAWWDWATTGDAGQIGGYAARQSGTFFPVSPGRYSHCLVRLLQSVVPRMSERSDVDDPFSHFSSSSSRLGPFRFSQGFPFHYLLFFFGSFSMGEPPGAVPCSLLVASPDGGLQTIGAVLLLRGKRLEIFLSSVA